MATKQKNKTMLVRLVNGPASLLNKQCQVDLFNHVTPPDAVTIAVPILCEDCRRVGAPPHIIGNVFAQYVIGSLEQIDEARIKAYKFHTYSMKCGTVTLEERVT